MKFFIVLAALVAVGFAASIDSEAVVTKLLNDQNPDGSYNVAVDTSNGISSQESGALKKGLNGETGEQGEAIAVKGSVQWTAPDGQVISLTYIADENGFQPQGAHLPTPPPAL